MGICQSKKSAGSIAYVSSPPEATAAGGDGATGSGGADSRLLPSSKRPPTVDEARNSDEYQNPRASRLSIKYQAKELSARGTANSRRSSTPFDRARIGTHTRHGLMPGPRGFSAAKINQDRGVVCWPFNGSYNQALLCVFDGHGSKGERASEFCMKTIPELLEAESTLLKKSPADCMSKNIIKTDQMLLSHPELGRLAMTCGTTSTVVYFTGNDVYTACSGDSRAVKGSRREGVVIAEDLSLDHKPDCPEERKRIIANGGTVSDGVAGRPSRVWAHGRIGLAMSRSIGDGECKGVGVIPDPELTHITYEPPATPDGDGDLFIVVASDGIWEFISSEEACQLIACHKNATEACSALVMEAAQRWKRYEGSYRDDITAIIAFLPFLESGWAEEEAIAGEDESEDASTSHVYLNVGQEGIAYGGSDSNRSGSAGAPAAGSPKLLGSGALGTHEEASEEAEAGAPSAAKGDDEDEESFAARRLSVHNPFDEDWNEVGEGEADDDDDDDEPPEATKPTAPLTSKVARV